MFSLVVASLHQRHPRAWWLLIVPAALWLIFLPNAPYIITDLWHLDERRPVPMWYDIGMLATFAWTGLFLAIASLNAMQNIVRDYYGHIVSWLFAFAAIGATGFGIYLGRFMRINSWDVFFQPHDVLDRYSAAPRTSPPLLANIRRHAVVRRVLFRVLSHVCRRWDIGRLNTSRTRIHPLSAGGISLRLFVYSLQNFHQCDYPSRVRQL